MMVMHVLGKSFGGIRQHVAALNAELNERDIHSAIVGPVGVMSGLAEQAGTFINPRIRKPWSIFFAARYIRTKSKGYDVIHAHGVTAGYLAYFSQFFIREKKPIILTLHNVANRTLMGKSYFLVAFLQALIISRVDHVVCPSKFAQSQLIQRQQKKMNISVVLPISKVFSDDEIDEAFRLKIKTREEYSLAKTDQVLICVARLNPQKDLQTLIDAFVFARANNSRLRLMIVGSGTPSQTSNLVESIDKSGYKDSIKFIGYSKFPQRLIATSQLMVLSSIYETVPLVLLEALQLGIPVVMTETGIANEILNGDCGSYVPVGDAFALAKEIEIWCSRIESNAIDELELRKVASSWLDADRCVVPLVRLYKSFTKESK